VADLRGDGVAPHPRVPMNRPSPIVALGAVSLALLVGCGNEADGATACRDEYVKLYTEVVRLLNEASPSDPDIDARMKKVLGTRPPKNCKDPRMANPTLEQVAREFGPQFDRLEDKWGRDNISGFRDPLGAGHGQPIGDRPPGD
jgi:hypothetical protein